MARPQEIPDSELLKFVPVENQHAIRIRTRLGSIRFDASERRGLLRLRKKAYEAFCFTVIDCYAGF